MKSSCYLKITLLLLVIFTFGIVRSSDYENYIYTLLSSNNKFIPNANCIYKEKDKYLWIGTDNGIYRFDGYEYKHYIINQKPFTKENLIKGIFFDKKNELWFISDNGIGKYIKENDTFEMLSLPCNHNNKNVFSYSMTEDAIYFGGINCIYKYTYKSDTLERFYEFNIKEPFLVMFINALPNNKILLSNQNDIALFDINCKKFHQNFVRLQSRISCIYVDRNNYIWVATYNNGLKCYDTNGTEIENFEIQSTELSSEVVLCIAERDSLLWLGTDGGGINILDKSDNSIKVLEHIPGNNNSLPSNSIKSIHIDYYGMIWAGSVRDGIINIQKSFMNTYQEVNLGSPFGLSNPSVVSVYQENGSDDLWIGTDGEGINKFNFKNKTFTHYPSTYKTKIVSIASFSKDELLLSLYLKGFFIFNKRSGAIRKFNINNEHIIKKAFYSETSVNVISETDDDILFVSDKVFRYNKHSSSFNEIKIKNNLKNFGYFLAAGKYKGEIYLFDNRAIYSLSPNSNSLNRVFHAGSEIIKVVNIDKNGYLWVATNNGLHKVSAVNGEDISIKKGVFKNISSIISNGEGTVWLGVDNRIYAYLEKDNSFALLGESQGARNNEYLKKSSLLANDGSICIGGSKGILIIDKKFKIDATEIPVVRITEVKLDGTPILIHNNVTKESITIPWDSKSIEVSVMSLEKDILRPKNFRFEIIGANPMIVESSTPTLKLHSLQTGYNSIYVSCSTGKGLWSRPVELLSIDVLPPWYRTWWFLTGCSFIIFTTIVIIFYSVLKRKENAMKIALKEHEKNVYEEKVRFLINMNHELRTPLTLIHAPLKRILSGMNNDDVNFIALSKIYRQSGRMKKLLNMVLDLRKMEIGENTLHLGTYNLNSWIISVVSDFISEGEAMGINISTELDENIKEISFDKEKMEVVITNLLVNALKHSECGSEILIKSEYLPDENNIKVSVVDSGCGLEGINIDKLFTRFYQGSNEKHGTGIGLSYSKVLVELHKGSIGAMNNIDKAGATFFFKLPKNLRTTDIECEKKQYLNEFLVSEEDIIVNSEDRVSDFSTENATLLIVDDSTELLDFMVEAINDKFKTILTASNGKEALEVIGRNIPNIIVSDVMMPEMDGYELCNKIKSNPDLCHIPIILLTARSEEQSKKYGYKVGADAFISKPFEMETLMEIIMSKLKNREQAKQHYMNLSAIPGMDKINMTSTEEVFINKLNSIIKENISNVELDINFICSEIGMSRASFYNKLKAVTDMSGKEYINKIRLEYAIMLIKTSELSFTEISEQTGFASSKYFSTSFKQYTGMTPTQYKKYYSKDKSENCT